MTNAHRLGSLINMSLEVIGDKWSLLILRNTIFGGRRHFRDLLNGSQEGSPLTSSTARSRPRPG